MTPGAIRRKSVVCWTVIGTKNVPSFASVSVGPAVQLPPPVDCSSVTGPLTARTLPVSVSADPAAGAPSGRDSDSSPRVTYVERRPSDPRRAPAATTVFCVPSPVVATSCRAWPAAGTGVTSTVPGTPSAFDICAPVMTTGPQLCQGEARS